MVQKFNFGKTPISVMTVGKKAAIPTNAEAFTSTARPTIWLNSLLVDMLKVQAKDRLVSIPLQYGDEYIYLFTKGWEVNGKHEGPVLSPSANGDSLAIRQGGVWESMITEGKANPDEVSLLDLIKDGVVIDKDTKTNRFRGMYSAKCRVFASFTVGDIMNHNVEAFKALGDDAEGFIEAMEGFLTDIPMLDDDTEGDAIIDVLDEAQPIVLMKYHNRSERPLAADEDEDDDIADDDNQVDED